MSIVLITGSCGLVGAESVKFFCNKGFDVIGIDNNYRKLFFGRDGDTNWVKKNLIKKYKIIFQLKKYLKNTKNLLNL